MNHRPDTKASSGKLNSHHTSHYRGYPRQFQLEDSKYKALCIAQEGNGYRRLIGFLQDDSNVGHSTWLMPEAFGDHYDDMNYDRAGWLYLHCLLLPS